MKSLGVMPRQGIKNINQIEVSPLSTPILTQGTLTHSWKPKKKLSGENAGGGAEFIRKLRGQF